jgi:hypothetical protein
MDSIRWKVRRRTRGRTRGTRRRTRGRRKPDGKYCIVMWAEPGEQKER